MRIYQTPDDDTALETIKLRDSEYDFNDLDFDGFPRLKTRQKRLCEVANRYYSDYEVVGVTEFDFSVSLQSVFDLGAGTLESYLSVYDNIVPDYESPDEVTTYETTNTSEASTADDEMPLDEEDGSMTRTGRTAGTVTQVGSTTVRSGRFGRGIENTSERLDKFLRLNKTIERLFVGLFRNCFLYGQVLK